MFEKHTFLLCALTEKLIYFKILDYEKNHIVYKKEEHYFLTDANQLIDSHFPDDENWQLLKNPIKIETFQVKFIFTV